jgi:hypothetical protein
MSRFSLVYVALLLMVGYSFIRKKNIKWQFRKYKKYIRLFLGGVVVVLFFLTTLRGVEGIISSFYQYLCCCVPLLTENLKRLPSQRYYGVISLMGFIAPIMFVLHQVFGLTYPQFYLESIELKNMADKATVISFNGVVSNAFVTPFFTLYADARFLGVAIGMFIWGLTSSLIFNKANKIDSDSNMAYVLLMTIPIIKAMQEYPFSNISFVLALLYTRIIINGVPIKRRAYTTG